MPADPTALRTLILAQPDGSPVRVAFAASDDNECARLLNTTPSEATVYRVLTRADILKVVSGYAAGPDLEAAKATNPAAWAALLLLASPDSELDMGDPAVRGLTAGLNGLGTPPEGYPPLGDVMVGAAAKPATLTESLLGYGGTVTPADVGAAR